MGEVKIVKGDLFAFNGLKAHCINTKNAMGAGIAVQFKKRYPAIYQQYIEDCFRERILPGGCWSYQDKKTSDWVFNLAGKDHWKDPAKLEWVQISVEFMIQQMKQQGMKEVAMPWIGCGLGGLKQEEVRRVLEEAVENTDITIWVYEL